MDKAHELDKMFDDLTAFIKTCDTTTYPEHWEAVRRYVYRASFIVFNFDKPIAQLEAELDRGEAGAREMDRIMKLLAKEKGNGETTVSEELATSLAGLVSDDMIADFEERRK